MIRFFAWLLAGVVYATSICADTLVGNIIPPFPAGLESKYGACIALSLGLSHACDYAVSDLRYPGKEPHAILLKKKVGVNEQKPLWKVTDQIAYPAIKEGEFLSFASCKLDGEPDYRILAVVEEKDQEWLAPSSWAATVDLESGRFARIPPDHIECENTGWGI